MTINPKKLALVAATFTTIALAVIAYQRHEPEPKAIHNNSEIADILSQARANDTAARVTSIVDSVKRLPQEDIDAAVNRIRFSGTYEIIYKGYPGGSMEEFELGSNGVAVWVYSSRPSGKLQIQKKYGTWEATDNSISVSINGNTGIITEAFRFKGNVLTSTEDKNRYLKKRPQ